MGISSSIFMIKRREKKSWEVEPISSSLVTTYRMKIHRVTVKKAEKTVKINAKQMRYYV